MLESPTGTPGASPVGSPRASYLDYNFAFLSSPEVPMAPPRADSSQGCPLTFKGQQGKQITNFVYSFGPRKNLAEIIHTLQIPTLPTFWELWIFF